LGLLEDRGANESIILKRILREEMGDE